MTDSPARRRGHGGDAIYFDASKDRYIGAVSIGFGPDRKRIRRKVSGRTKAEVRDKLKALHAELDRGLRTSSTYTVQKAVDDWLEGGLPGRSERTRGRSGDQLAARVVRQQHRGGIGVQDRPHPVKQRGEKLIGAQAR